MTDLRELFEEFIANERDSLEHKRYMLTDDLCFVEWVEERYPDRAGEL